MAWTFTPFGRSEFYWTEKVFSGSCAIALLEINHYSNSGHYDKRVKAYSVHQFVSEVD